MRSPKAVMAANPRWWAAVWASLAFFMFMAGFTGFFANDRLDKMAVTQGVAANTLKSISQESAGLLVKLNQSYSPDCADDKLWQLRLEVFKTAYLGDIGVFDAQGRLLCSTLLGLLPHPIVVQKPDVRFVAPNGQQMEVNFGMQIVAGGGRFKTTLVKMGRFNVVITPKAMEHLLSQGMDTIMFHPSNGVFMPVFVNPQLSPQQIKRLQQSDVLGAPMHRFNWDTLAFISSQRVGASFFYVQSITPLKAFLNRYRTGLWAALLVSLLIGALTFNALVPNFARWNQLDHRIHSLLTPDNLICVYQPVVELATGTMVGCEVLMRLRDTQGQMVYPDQALPAIVRQKLTWTLDQMVVTKAIAELEPLLRDFPQFRVSFNFFPENIDNLKICELVHTVLKNLRPMDIKLDLQVVEEMWQQTIVRELTDLKTAGYLVSVDDFGTGYSNLSSIKKLLPDFLKIDKSFVFDMEENSLRSSLIPEIVGIAKAVGARVIAEGVEKEAQRQMLMDFGVEFGQGRLFARPMEIFAFANYAAQSRSIRQENVALARPATASV